ncbi:BlaI/MecI/CopY family transcriptional regulator [Globicatella sp. PHS-GS-PNBC-21-1553]|uniref:BlaI/MecI/CopY family transcriptional regulator n=1 Tax=Globicatella sp. PHS-GS-PNBC-21-1553 TaxID=2885764 RepID=UPI00298ED2EE|nr:BlaI/MecI/CopY family transcriptional regulator [Globicatella sp. PHS-GS-PNBC-21-1553]WPC09304.1 BlaI/MecI/CopY family transcriptional regulator [Globicatella sp. PHS-GS-PNBC-21-1553]
MENATITSAEWEVMRVVWAKSTLTSREIIDTLTNILDWKEGTIKSLLNRLVQKGYLKQDSSVKPMLYQATISANQALQTDLGEIMARSCTKDRGLHIEQLIQHETLSQEQCQMLIQLIEEKMKNAPEIIKCQCPPGQCTCQHHTVIIE